MGRQRDIKVNRKPLFRANDLTKRNSWKSLRERRKIYPEIHYVIDTSESTHEVKDVEVRISLVRRSRRVERSFEPYELLLPGLWSKLYGDDVSLLPEFHPGFFPERGLLKDHEVGSSIASKRWPPVTIFERILDYCHSVGGAITISRNEFALWLSRLHWVAYDIERMLSCEVDNWPSLQEEISEILDDEYSGHFEFYHKNRWVPLMEGQMIKPKEALKNRLRDARSLLNLFSSEVKPHGAPESFLCQCYGSFGEKLCRESLLIRCDVCGAFALFWVGKKYCSNREEGKNCGIAAKNKRYYEKNRAKIRDRARKSASEYRRFLKEESIRRS